MNRVQGWLLMSLAVTTGLFLSARFLPIQAQVPRITKEAVAIHGGAGWVGLEHAFEVVASPRGVRLYAYDYGGTALDIARLRVKATVCPALPGNAPSELGFRPVVPSAASQYWEAALDWSRPRAANAVLRVLVCGLASAVEQVAAFEVSLDGLAAGAHP